MRPTPPAVSELPELPEHCEVYDRLGLTREKLEYMLEHGAGERMPDGVREVRLFLADVADAFSTTVPVPLPYVDLNEDIVEYVEDEVSGLPETEPVRIVLLLPPEAVNAGDEALLQALAGRYFKERIARRAREAREALRSVGSACFWGFVFMLGCQIVRWLADFPDYPTITSTISEGMLVLGWVALWNPYDRLLFSWWPAVKRLRLVRRIARAEIVLRAAPFDLSALKR